jgi:hypothetical protein
VIQNPPDGIATGAEVNVIGAPAAGVAQTQPKRRDQHG